MLGRIEIGKVPIWASTFVQDHLRPAAIKAGVRIAPGQRYGLHNCRHSLATWMANAGKVAPKTVQRLLRQANVKTTLGVYTQDDQDEKQLAQGTFLSAAGLGSRANPNDPTANHPHRFHAPAAPTSRPRRAYFTLKPPPITSA